MRHLPGLGSLLYLHATSSAVVTDALAPGVLVAWRDFAPLLETRWLVATSVVTDDGPARVVRLRGWLWPPTGTAASVAGHRLSRLGCVDEFARLAGCPALRMAKRTTTAAR